eukprot:6203785-Pleurochrysis_carterae.AAC.5
MQLYMRPRNLQVVSACSAFGACCCYVFSRPSIGLAPGFSEPAEDLVLVAVWLLIVIHLLVPQEVLCGVNEPHRGHDPRPIWLRTLMDALRGEFAQQFAAQKIRTGVCRGQHLKY